MTNNKSNDKEIEELIDKHEIVIGILKDKKTEEKDFENENKEIEIENQILSIYNNFYSNLQNIDDFFKLNNKLLKSEEKKNNNKRNKFVKKYKIKEDNQETVLGLTKEQFKEFHKNNLQKKVVSQHEIILPKSMLIYFHSLFEHFLSKILVLIYNTSEDQLKESDIKFTFSDLKNFDSIEDAKNFVINNRISNILFSGIDKQLDCIFNLLGIKEEYQKGFPKTELIEISLRRNLFTHEDGIVNDIYLTKCKEYGISNKFKKGEKVCFEENYFDLIYKTYYESVIKIVFFMWIKFSTNEKKYDVVISEFINNRAFSMIKKSELDLGLKILDFILVPKFISKIDEATNLMLVINKALIFKMKDNQKNVNELLDNIDWSAKSDLYKFANFILKEEWKNAGDIMLKIVKKKEGDETLSSYELKTWPLFFQFREQEIFKKNYKKIFKKDFKLYE